MRRGFDEALFMGPFYVETDFFVKFARLNGNRYGYDKYFGLC